ncbi:MAG: hypothetical protein H7232_06720 [Aeromicrobium sp.]|nr:hypothetical protein [Burkholderiales bacterium]
MSFRSYIESHFIEACDPQRNVGLDKSMLTMLKKQEQDPILVKTWMQSYGLFQGINGVDREKVVRRFLDFAASQERLAVPLSDEDVSRLVLSLLKSLNTEVPRGWLSATSKLLWCMYPHDVVIYDSFVHRALTVMQCIDGDLSGFNRKIGRLRAGSDPHTLLAHYMTYQAMVRHLSHKHADLLLELRRRNGNALKLKSWSFDPDIHSDIRIVDKLLWMIGDPSDLHLNPS